MHACASGFRFFVLLTGVRVYRWCHLRLGNRVIWQSSRQATLAVWQPGKSSFSRCTDEPINFPEWQRTAVHHWYYTQLWCTDESCGGATDHPSQVSAAVLGAWYIHYSECSNDPEDPEDPQIPRILIYFPVLPLLLPFSCKSGDIAFKVVCVWFVYRSVHNKQ